MMKVIGFFGIFLLVMALGGGFALLWLYALMGWTLQVHDMPSFVLALGITGVLGYMCLAAWRISDI